MTTRRTLLATGGALALLGLAACNAPTPPPAAPEAPAGPGSVTVSATGAPGMNLGPDGADRPLTLTLLQLRTSAAFEGLDFFALQAPETTLGADLVSATQVAIAPGGSASTVIELDPATTVIGIVGGFRDPAGKVFRISAPVTPGTSSTLSVAVTGSGVALQSA